MMKEPMGKHNRLVSERASADYDYVIVDSRGHRGVKDGKEFPISEEEWQRTHPEHRNTDCKECTFVPDAETILVFHVVRERRAVASEKPEFVGKFTMAQWSGHSSFYLFRCKECGTVVVDYPHGYTSWGSCYLSCSKCGWGPVLRKREDYERDNITVPLVAMSFKERYKALVKMFEELEKSKPVDKDGI